MDQRSDDIRNNIESTRASLDQKLGQLEHKAKETFDLKHQVQEHPFMMLGAAVLTGYVLGSLGGDSAPTYRSGLSSAYPNPNVSPDAQNHHSHGGGNGFMSQFDEEIGMLKTAAIATLGGMFRDIVKEVAPAIGQQMDKMKSSNGRQLPSGDSSIGQSSLANSGSNWRDGEYSSNQVDPLRPAAGYDSTIPGDHH